MMLADQLRAQYLVTGKRVSRVKAKRAVFLMELAGKGATITTAERVSGLKRRTIRQYQRQFGIKGL